MSDLLFERITTQHPQFTELCTTLNDLKTKKLYFQLTNEIFNFINNQFISTLNLYKEFYDVFIYDIQTKIAPTKLIQIITKINKQLQPAAAIELLQSIEKVIEIDIAARCLYYSLLAELYIHQNELIQSRDLLEKAQIMLAHEEGLESIVYSEYYRITAVFYQVKQNPNLYYKNIVNYLKYVDIKTLEIDDQLVLAKNMMMSSLLGENVFDFASFLNSPLAVHFGTGEVLPGITQNMTELNGLFMLIKAINSGMMNEVNTTLEGLKEFIMKENALAHHLDKIKEKASLVCLMELIFRTQSTKRTFSFEKISEVTLVPLQKVEVLIMRAMNLELVKGFIDQCKEEVTFTWVMPRVLDKEQFLYVKQQLDEWESMTRKTLELLAVEE